MLTSVSSVSGGHGGDPGRLCVWVPRNGQGRGTALAPPDWADPPGSSPVSPSLFSCHRAPQGSGGVVSGHTALAIALGESSSVAHGLGGSMALEASPGKGPARSSPVTSVQMRPGGGGDELSHGHSCWAAQLCYLAAAWLSGVTPSPGWLIPSCGVGCPLWAVIPQGAR